MYAYLNGKIVSKNRNNIVIDVNNIGYKVLVPMTFSEKLEEGIEARIYTHLHVREDEMSLYGFETEHDLFLYEIIISVSGVGPKVGIAILSTLTSQEVGLAIATNNVKKLTSVPGIGNKMAQRIVLELKDKITKEQLVNKEELGEGSSDMKLDAIKEEVACALQVLGYTNKEIQNVFKIEKFDNLDTEEAIKLALKKLSSKR